MCQIASEDPVVYGDAVYSAQVMLGECIGGSTARIMQEETESTVIQTKASIIPNPNNGTMQANIDLKDDETGKLEIYDLTGKKLSVYSLKPGKNGFTIDETHLEQGVYLYRITVNDVMIEGKKLIIVK